MNDKTDDTNAQPEEALEAARAWVMRLSRSTVGETDWTDFNAWLDASEGNGKAYDQAINLWSEYQAFANAPRLSKPKGETRIWRRYLIPGLGIAAAVLLALPVTEAMTPPQVFKTEKGETRTVWLEDGTRIDLNTASTVKVKLGWRTRQVEMADAEAVFDVAKDRRRPFVIAAGDEQIRVVGTKFNVRRRDGAQSVTVERGRVEVSARDGTQKVALTPGQRLDHIEGKSGALVRAFDPAIAMSWRSGRLIYRDEPLSIVTADLSRLPGPAVRAADLATAKLRFSGVISARNSDEAAKVLVMLTPVTLKETPQGLVLRQN
jgi:transmembrane sensor